MILQAPPLYTSKEPEPMLAWFRLLRTLVNENRVLIDEQALANRLILGTPIALTSGTSHDFTGIPAGTRRVTMMFDDLSTNGTSVVIIQLGDAGGIETTGYNTTASSIAQAVGTTSQTTGFPLEQSWDNTVVVNSSIIFTLMNETTNTWVASGVFSTVDKVRTVTSAGRKSLSSELTQLRLTTVGGTNIFDSGSVNIMYEK